MSRWVVPALLIGTASFCLGVACTVNTSPAGPAADSGTTDSSANGEASTANGDSASTDAANGAAACVASGGQCVLGGRPCAHVGTSDCNPDRNPGGAFCCLDTPDANLTSCPSGLGDAGFTMLSDLPIAALCAESPRLYKWNNECAGAVVVVQGIGVDCDRVWLFSPATGALEAVGGGCNVGAQCTGGVPGFQFPSACFDGNFAGDPVNLCPVDEGDSGGDAPADASHA